MMMRRWGEVMVSERRQTRCQTPNPSTNSDFDGADEDVHTLKRQGTQCHSGTLYRNHKPPIPHPSVEGCEPHQWTAVIVSVFFFFKLQVKTGSGLF